MEYTQADISIANMALRRIGADSITLADINSTTKIARLVNSYTAPTIKEVLRLLPWTNAITRSSQLTGVADTSTQYLYKIDISSIYTDILRILNINGDNSISYSVEGKFLFCNVQNIRIKYIKALATADINDPVLIESIVSRLATKFVYALTGQAEMLQLLYQEFMLNIGIAQKLAVSEIDADPIDIFALYQQNYQMIMRQNKAEG